MTASWRQVVAAKIRAVAGHLPAGALLAHAVEVIPLPPPALGKVETLAERAQHAKRTLLRVLLQAEESNVRAEQARAAQFKAVREFITGRRDL